MDTFLAVVILIGAVVGVLALKSLLRKAAKAINKNVLFKSEFKEQQQFISTTLTFLSVASISDIMRQLTVHVAPAQAVPVVRGTVYQISASDDTVIYAFGNKLYPQSFVVSISFTNRGTATQGVFNFLKWHESDGMLPSMSVMEKLRNNIIAAFTAADSAVRITEGTVSNDFAEPAIDNIKPNPENWECSCGAYNNKGDAFCGGCGKRNIT